MNVDIKKVVGDLKEPTLIFKLNRKEDRSPDLTSHVGGTPYTEKHDRIPLCHQCKQGMEFVFQLVVPNETDKDLFSFYYCFHCMNAAGSKGFKIKHYKNPCLEKMNQKEKKSSVIAYGEFEFTPFWSLPDWDTLSLLHPDVYKLFLKEYEEEAELNYENLKEEILNSLYFDSFSFFGGYPNYIGFPTFPTCEHCKKTMDLWMQIDSDSIHNLAWKDHSCLHIFKCKHDAPHYKILIQ